MANCRVCSSTLYIAFLDEQGELLLYNSTNYKEKIVETRKYRAITATQSGNFAIDEEGFLWNVGMRSQFFYDSNQYRTPTYQVTFTPEIEKIQHEIPFIDISGGGQHLLAVDDEGMVWGFGRNHYNQLGLENEMIDNTLGDRYIMLTQIKTISNIIKVSCGYEHSLALDANGNVFGVGGNSVGQLGLGDRKDRKTFTINENLKSINQISCCTFHSLFLNSNGEVFSVGSNSSGELGLGDREGRLIPQRIADIPKVEIISCNIYFSMFIDIEGVLWVFGSNGVFELGLGDQKDRLSPVINPTLKHQLIIIISSSGKLACAKDSNDKVWIWGSQNFKIPTPLKMKTKQDFLGVTSISKGKSARK